MRMTAWLFELESIGAVERHDMFWPNVLTKLRLTGHDLLSTKVKEAALSYWKGERHPSGDGIWEFLAREARIVSVEPAEACDAPTP